VDLKITPITHRAAKWFRVERVSVEGETTVRVDGRDSTASDRGSPSVHPGGAVGLLRRLPEAARCEHGARRTARPFRRRETVGQTRERERRESRENTTELVLDVSTPSPFVVRARTATDDRPVERVLANG
jgi:hypothetical protein